MASEGLVLRNGRYTDQISVYNYPEHLNPFYEDENHKRLRFWKIRKNNNNDVRGSTFSLSGLKDMWLIRSFRIRKKSSNLGINKTSESPPPLRHTLHLPNSNGRTLNSSMGNMNDVSAYNNYFDNKEKYRYSLQDITANENIDNNQDDISFTRMSKYRNTIQVATPRRKAYAYDGSISPQFSMRSVDYNGTISQRSSQLSLASTNPFECNGDDKSDAMKKTNSRSNTLIRSPAKKKYRAPQPPINISKVEIQEPSDVADQHDSKKIEEDINITNLTAEIQNYVKSVNELEENLVESKTDAKTSVNVINSNVETENTKLVTENIKEHDKNIRNQKQDENELESCTITRDEKEKSNLIDTDKQSNDVQEEIQEEESVEIKNANIRVDSSDTCLQINDESNMKLPELKITESKEDISSIPLVIEELKLSNETVSNDNQESVTTNLTETGPKLESVKQSICLNNSNSNNNNNNGSKGILTPYEQRRYVKEVIESINRNQSLLKVNHDQTSYFDDSERCKVKECHIKNTVKDMSKSNGCDNNRNDESQSVKVLVEGSNNFTNENNAKINNLSTQKNVKINNNEISKQCTVNKKETNREPSPTLQNLDWNPVPKPRRTKNLSPKLIRVTPPEVEKI